MIADARVIANAAMTTRYPSFVQLNKLLQKHQFGENVLIITISINIRKNNTLCGLFNSFYLSSRKMRYWCLVKSPNLTIPIMVGDFTWSWRICNFFLDKTSAGLFIFLEFLSMTYSIVF